LRYIASYLNNFFDTKIIDVSTPTTSFDLIQLSNFRAEYGVDQIEDFFFLPGPGKTIIGHQDPP